MVYSSARSKLCSAKCINKVSKYGGIKIPIERDIYESSGYYFMAIIKH